MRAVIQPLKKIKPKVIKVIRTLPYSERVLRIPSQRISYADTEKYFLKNPSSDSYFKKFQANNLVLRPPKILNRDLKHFKYNYLKEYNCESFLIQLENGRFFLRSHSIFTQENYHLAIVSSHSEQSIDEHIAFNMFYIPKPAQFSGTGLLLVTQFDNNYYHCLFQITAKIWFLKNIGFDLNSVDHYFLGINNTAYQNEILEALEISTEKIIDINQHNHIKAERLVITPVFFSPEPWMISLLKKTFLPDQVKLNNHTSQKRIYVSRNKASYRKIINEDFLWSVLEKYGFEYITNENRSIMEQANLFANADMIVSAHSAALANTVFCKTGTKVLEIRGIEHVFLHYRLYEHLSSIAELRHYTLLCKGYPNEYSTNPSGHDLEVNPNQFEEVILEFIND